MENGKISLKDKAVLRNDLYNTLEESLTDLGMTVEPGAEGMIVHLDNGLFAEVAVTIKNEDKFDIEVARQKYADKVQRAADRAAKSAEIAAKKAEKAAEKLAKEQAKASATPEA